MAVDGIGQEAVEADRKQRDAVAIAVADLERAVAATLGAILVEEHYRASVGRLEADVDHLAVDLEGAVAGEGGEANRAGDENAFDDGLSCLCCLFAPCLLLSCRFYAIH